MVLWACLHHIPGFMVLFVPHTWFYGLESFCFTDKFCSSEEKQVGTFYLFIRVSCKFPPLLGSCLLTSSKQLHLLYRYMFLASFLVFFHLSQKVEERQEKDGVKIWQAPVYTCDQWSPPTQGGFPALPYLCSPHTGVPPVLGGDPQV